MGAEESVPIKCPPGMKVGVLGSGEVGRTLANSFLELGHHVMLGGRQKEDPKTKAWLDSITDPEKAKNAKVSDYAEIVEWAGIIVLATLGTATESVVNYAGGPDKFAGKIVLDTTNPLTGQPPVLVGSLGSSGGEITQKLLPRAQVVKVFNSVGHKLMFRPKLNANIRPTMFICGDDATAKNQVKDLLSDFGWDAMDVGGINNSHYLESLCLVWVNSALIHGNWNQAFAMLPGA